MIRVHIENLDFGHALAIYVIDGRDPSDRAFTRHDAEEDILRLTAEGPRWSTIEGERPEPSLVVQRHVGEALGNALATFFAGSSDVAFLKKVYERSEARVDTLIKGLTEMRK